jgi:fimbrial chaperone protein
MIRKQAILLALATAPLWWTSSASAAQLRVEPVLLEMTAPAAAGTLKLRNEEDSEVTVQTRVLRWSQAAGKETLEPTTDVVASPPAVTLAPGADYVVRVVRVSKQPVVGEESYRVIVDQLPNVRRQQARTVNLLIRQSIPVFFRARELNPPIVSWSISSEEGKLVLVASNAGDERLRLASLRLKNSAGATISFGNGLVGYVLGRSSMSWIAPKQSIGFAIVGPVSLTAETDKGPTHAVVQEPARR